MASQLAANPAQILSQANDASKQLAQTHPPALVCDVISLQETVCNDEEALSMQRDDCGIH